MSDIKRRRLDLPVRCRPGIKVGDCVPFYFCPRSIMLYLIDRANHPNLEYRGGQEPIVHLEADVKRVVGWAETRSVEWAFSLSNAGARYSEFRSSVKDLEELDWEAIASTDFRGHDTKEAKRQ